MEAINPKIEVVTDQSGRARLAGFSPNDLPSVMFETIVSRYHEPLEAARMIEEMVARFGAGRSYIRSKRTMRQREICKLIDEGLTDDEIAGRFDMHPNSIKYHRKKIAME